MQEHSRIKEYFCQGNNRPLTAVRASFTLARETILSPESVPFGISH
jgi:hypothetical protein